MNKLLFAGLIIFNINNIKSQSTTPLPSTTSEFSTDCPCFGNAFDILGACADQVDNQRDIGCFADAFGFIIGGTAFVNCFDATSEGPFGGPILDALTSPLFGVVEIFGFGICVNSPRGILGLIFELFEFIADEIGDFDDCFDDRRRLIGQGGNPWHGSVVALEGFVDLLECKSRGDCLHILFQEGGIVQLVQKMKALKDGSGSARRALLSSEEGEFGICDFGFLGGFLADPLGDFEPADAPFEALLAGLFRGPDCDDPDSFFEFIVCEILDAIGGAGLGPSTTDDRRRLLSADSPDGDSGDSGEGDGDFPLIVFDLSEAEEQVCALNLNDAENCLDGFAEDGCIPGIQPSTTDGNGPIGPL